jgi:hypothetical protein
MALHPHLAPHLDPLLDLAVLHLVPRLEVLLPLLAVNLLVAGLLPNPTVDLMAALTAAHTAVVKKKNSN